jgi:DNA polymerase
VNSEEILRDLAAQINGCQNCGLAQTRKHAVPGKGPANAEIMLIGEGPGFHENEQGLPFVGQAGKFLDELLAAGGFERDAVFITNVVKCRPPGNRDPLPEELAACSRYLDRQIESINPRVIVTLGRYSMAKFIPNAKISEIHGKPRWGRGRLIVPMYHPAAALRLGSLRTVMKDDFASLPQWVEQARQSAPAQVASTEANTHPANPPLEDDPAQLDIFSVAPSAAPSPPPQDQPTPAEPDEPAQLSLF